MAAPGAPALKMCHYEVMGVARDIDADGLKKAYKKGALRWHPDKNPNNMEEASEKFKQLREAYEVLQDEHERAWYDAHREAILSGKKPGAGNKNAAGEDEPETDPDGLNLMSYFTTSCFKDYSDEAEDGFYKVYGGLFEKLAALEVTAWKDAGRSNEEVAQSALPLFGTSTGEAREVRSFYSAWINFISSRTMSWADKWNLGDATSRQVRRAMEKENKDARTLRKREYNENIRNLVRFVKKRDKRVMAYEQKERLEEQQRATEVKAAAAAAAAAKRVEREQYASVESERHAEQARIRRERYGEIDDAEEAERRAREEVAVEYECVVCSKTFKSEKQYENHEKSKAHAAAVKREQALIEDMNESDEEETSDEDEEHDWQCAACNEIFENEEACFIHSETPKHKVAAAALRAQLEADEDLWKRTEQLVMSDEDDEDEPILPAAAAKKNKKKQQQAKKANFGDDFEAASPPPLGGKAMAASKAKQAAAAKAKAAEKADGGQKKPLTKAQKREAEERKKRHAKGVFTEEEASSSESESEPEPQPKKKKAAPKKKKAASSSESESEEEEEAPKKKSKGKKKKQASSSESESEEEEAPKKKSKAAPVKKKTAASSSSSESEAEDESVRAWRLKNAQKAAASSAAPAASSSSTAAPSKKKPAAVASSSESEEELPKKKASKKQASKKAASSSESESEKEDTRKSKSKSKPTPVKKSKKVASSSSESESEEELPQPVKKGKAKAGKR